MKKMFSLMAGLLMAGFGSVHAQEAAKPELTGLYLTGSGGWNWREDADDELAEARFECGVLWSAGVGYSFQNAKTPLLQNARMELEFSKQYNDLETLWLHPNAAVNRVEDAIGSIDHEAYQMVLAYDFPIGRFKPYIGIGLGFGRSILNDLATVTLINYGGAPGSYPLNTTTGYEFCYSPRVGVGYALSDRVDLFVGARYHFVDEVTIEAPPSLSEVAIDSTLNNATHPPVETYMLEGGLRYKF